MGNLAKRIGKAAAPGAAVAVCAGVLLGGVAAPAGAQQAAPGGATTLGTHHGSAACKTPKGSKINISWGDGNVSTTVYYNNHCKQKRAIVLQFVRENGTRFDKCFVAPARTKGHKKIGYAMPNKVRILAKGSC